MPYFDLKEKRIAFHVIDLAIKLVVLYAIAAWCFGIISPFISPILWAMIIAVAIYPLHQKLTKLFNGKEGRAATCFALITITLIMIPTVLATGSIFDSIKSISTLLINGNLQVPAPSQSIAEWPLVGDKVYDFWLLASQNLESALIKIEPQLGQLGKQLIGLTVSGGLVILQFIFAVIVAAMLLAHSKSAQSAAKQIANRLAGEQGHNYVALAAATIKSVAQGVLGIACIQAIFAALGLVIMGVPFAGVWTLIVLFLAIVQLPPILILGPIIAYVFSVSPGTEAVIFAVWCVIVSGSDTFLKPLLLGRGVDVPMIVILMGAIGGMLMSGIIGLFVGAVVLSVGYKLLLEWLSHYKSESEKIASLSEIEK
ncbi:AI-2E family transporter [Psychromonas sp. MME2]|uniref:AI-2E family transporter n=1 Tax=unclassified Psychromonas TaxID=2614957 RepID=UPI00339BFA81